MTESNGHVIARCILSKTNDGYGFLKSDKSDRSSDEGNRVATGDVYVSQSQIRRFGLRSGDQVAGQVRPPKDGERYFSLIRVEAINDIDPDAARTRPHFEELVPIFPEQRIVLETEPKELSTRVIDMISPIGRGQRGLIVSPPKAGKTTLLKQISGMTI